MKNHILILILLSSNFLFGQNRIDKIAGVYSDDLGGVYTTKLQMNKDSTYNIVTVDPEFPYTFQMFENNGKFTIKDDKVILNPNLRKRNIDVDLKILDNNLSVDSLHFRINYKITFYEKNEVDTIQEFEFETLTIILNNEKNSTHLTRHPIRRQCLLSREVKNQIIVDESNMGKIAKQDVERIGIYSYGFEDVVWIVVPNSNSNNFEININHPIDRERMPRSKEVLMKKKKAYYYETEGKIDESLLPLNKKTGR